MKTFVHRSLYLFVAFTSSLAPAPLTAQTLEPKTNSVPYVKLFTSVSSVTNARAINNLPAAARNQRLIDLTRWYTFFEGESANEFVFGDATKGPLTPGKTLAEGLTALGAVVANYRNGSYVSAANRGQSLFGEAADLERHAPLAIATWWPGQLAGKNGNFSNMIATLIAPLDINLTTIAVTSPSAYRPAVAPETWPFIPSRGRGALPGNPFSDSTADFVSWVRIDNEIMRVRTVAQSAAGIVLGVDRGYFGTPRVAHAKGARVFVPVYIGVTATPSFDPAGSPPVNSPARSLRYALKIWQADAATWLARRVTSSFGNNRPAPYLQGYNAVWLDVTSCAQLNCADSFGQPITPWDDSMQVPSTPEAWGNHQVGKLRELKSRLATAGYPNVQFIINSVAHYGRPGDDCRTRLLTMNVAEGGALEYWLQYPPGWTAAMTQHVLIQSQNLPGIYSANWAELDRSFAVPQYVRFAYGSYLLGWHPTATRPRFGGPFGLNPPDEMFFWDFGAPAKAIFSLDDLTTITIRKPTGTAAAVKFYRRDFANGIVIVNPSRERARVELGGEFIDPINTDLKGRTLKVTNVEVGPTDAAFLFKP